MLKILLYLFILVLLLVAVLGYFLLKEVGAQPSDNDLARFSHLSYFKNGEFVSPEPLLNNIKNMDEPFSWFDFLFSRKNAPKSPLPMQKLSKENFKDSPEDFVFYWLGHSSLIAEFAGLRVIFDPVFGSAAPLPFAQQRYSPSPLELKDLRSLDIVIITHNHYDHLERKTIQSIIARHFIVPLGLKKVLVKWGVDEDKITELGWGDEVEISGLKITAWSAIHYSSRSHFDKNKSLWNSYILQSGDKKFYISGDSGYGKHFKQIGEKFGPFELVALEIDAWNKGWPNTHMFPKQSLKAANDLGAKAMLPLHWGTFDLAFHKWNESIEIVYQNKGDLRLITPILGQKFGPNTATTPWWQGLK